jgi:hypothetical protein
LYSVDAGKAMGKYKKFGTTTWASVEVKNFGTTISTATTSFVRETSGWGCNSAKQQREMKRAPKIKMREMV